MRVFGLAIFLAVTLAASIGTAQTNVPPTTTSPVAKTASKVGPPAAKTVRAVTPRSETSMKCTQEADARSLHGKARKSFRSTCKKQAKRGMLSR